MISKPHAGSPRYFRALGICWVIYGVLAIVIGLWLVSFRNTATLMFGALLNRVPDPFTLMDEFHLLFGVAVVWVAICGVLGILAGWALLAGLRSARTLVLVAAILSLPRIPLGTTLGIFSLVLLFLSSFGDAATASVGDQASPPETAATWRRAVKSG